MLLSSLTISPSASSWWNFTFVVLTGMAAGSLHLTGVPDAWISLIKGWSADGAFLISCANLVFHLFSSPDPGPVTRVLENNG